MTQGVYQPTFFLPTAFLQYLFYRHMELEPYIRLDQLKVSDKQTLYSIPVHDGFADVEDSLRRTPKLRSCSLCVDVGG